MKNEEKNLQIKLAGSATRKRRKSLCLKVVSVKLDESHISNEKKEKLESAFREAKWIYNDLLHRGAIFEKEGTLRSVTVQTFNPETQKCDIPDERCLTLSSQIKQAIVQRARQDVINLAKAKAKGIKIGKLNFKKEVNCLPLQQFGVTYRIGENAVFIQKLGRFRVRGLDQIRDAVEFGFANFVRKPSGYYLNMVCYFEKEEIQTSGEIGIDMGIRNTATLSDGRVFDMKVPLPKTIRTAQRKLARQKRGSRNYIKQVKRLRRKHERWSNRKDDLANKFVFLLKKYSLVAIQDESIKGWSMGEYGKQVSESVLGRIKAKIRNLPTSVMIDRFLPTTKFCHHCGRINDIPLNMTVIRCDCGNVEGRDVKSANTILYFTKLPPAERGRSPVESVSSSLKSSSFQGKTHSLKQEAPML